MKKNRTRLLLTIGDPNGIGPEIILKIFCDKNFISRYDLTIAGSKKILDYYSFLLKLKKIPGEKIIELPLPKGFKIRPGLIEKSAGKVSGDAIKAATLLCLEKKFSGMITLPVSKESLNLGGYHYPGHTEMLTDLTGSENTVMILHSEKFSTALITGHVPVSEIKNHITIKNLSGKLITVNNSFVRNFKVNHPRIALLSLNPHAGDGGLIGNEEQRILCPVIENLNSTGFNIRGPFAADAFFANKNYVKFDATVAMYHDQGLIPFKMISFGKGVNFTAGLNIIRTSPDHGTAFDIAGMGRANPESTKEAIELAGRLSDF